MLLSRTSWRLYHQTGPTKNKKVHKLKISFLAQKIYLLHCTHNTANYMFIYAMVPSWVQAPTMRPWATMFIVPKKKYIFTIRKYYVFFNKMKQHFSSYLFNPLNWYELTELAWANSIYLTSGRQTLRPNQPNCIIMFIVFHVKSQIVKQRAKMRVNYESVIGANYDS